MRFSWKAFRNGAWFQARVKEFATLAVDGVGLRWSAEHFGMFRVLGKGSALAPPQGSMWSLGPNCLTEPRGGAGWRVRLEDMGLKRCICPTLHG